MRTEMQRAIGCPREPGNEMAWKELEKHGKGYRQADWSWKGTKEAAEDKARQEEAELVAYWARRGYERTADGRKWQPIVGERVTPLVRALRMSEIERNRAASLNSCGL